MNVTFKNMNWRCVISEKKPVFKPRQLETAREIQQLIQNVALDCRGCHQRIGKCGGTKKTPEIESPLTLPILPFPFIINTVFSSQRSSVAEQLFRKQLVGGFDSSRWLHFFILNGSNLALNRFNYIILRGNYMILVSKRMEDISKLT